MFTVKHVTKDGERFYETSGAVQFVRAGVPVDAETKASDRSQIMFTAYGVRCTIDGGRVYVMNAVGKTIDTFFLQDDPDYPHGLSR